MGTVVGSSSWVNSGRAVFIGLLGLISLAACGPQGEAGTDTATSEAVAAADAAPDPISQAKKEATIEAQEQLRFIMGAVGRIVAPNGIDEQRRVELNGYEQWIMLRGHDKDAPLLLFLHGGPGSPISPIAYSYQRPWEDFFTVVHWDQRGFGRSRPRTPEEREGLNGTLNRPSYVADTVALIETLTEEFGQEKVILVGQSWGTVLALEVGLARPDLVHVVVTQGLAANWLASPEILYDYLLETAKADGNEAEVARLEELGPVPVDEVEKMFEWGPKLGVGFPDPNTWHNIRGEGDGWGPRLMALESISPDVTREELEASKAEAAQYPAMMYSLYKEAMTSVLPWDAERDAGTNLPFPWVVMQGSFDWQTSRDLAKDYYDKVCAPWKKWVEFPYAAHALNIERPGLSVVSLVQDVLPAVKGGKPADAEVCEVAD